MVGCVSDIKHYQSPCAYLLYYSGHLGRVAHRNLMFILILILILSESRTHSNSHSSNKTYRLIP